MAIDRRNHIVEAARQSFAFFGYKATTVDQVAKQANVGKGTIYNFFKNKEELFQEIVSQLLIEMKEKAEAAMEDGRTYKENLHLALYELLEYRMKHQFTIKMLQEAREMGTPAVKEALTELEQATIQYITSKINEAVEHGEMVVSKPEVTAFVVVKLYISLIFDWEERHEPLNKEEIMKIFDEHVFKGLSPE
ncbi:TetR family transcriptional regulator [Pontibacillus halophilus JSM 076056 = DSM 19796]|uniref:TetR family transcriptional regulator n=1 Tax=Pontibacillus halophilus JSM 076056 = DSM 19796 TaxID=1385510 RepID=A0A0A5GNV2_9BACI|nr:TetR/AcrR family transcriptional regulator [Pontibacillus halophilus]KGX92850.1 TetR family transcriptional regulator [Pontibacillus halophilus JSM 076056 = DSM 19796]